MSTHALSGTVSDLVHRYENMSSVTSGFARPKVGSLGSYIRKSCVSSREHTHAVQLETSDKRVTGKGLPFARSWVARELVKYKRSRSASTGSAVGKDTSRCGRDPHASLDVIDEHATTAIPTSSGTVVAQGSSGDTDHVAGDLPGAGPPIKLSLEEQPRLDSVGLHDDCRTGREALVDVSSKELDVFSAPISWGADLYKYDIPKTAVSGVIIHTEIGNKCI